MRNERGRSWIAMLVAVALLALPLQATAEMDDGASASNGSAAWSKFFDLAGCVVGIATISSGVGFVLASLACGKAASEWWTT